MSTTKEKRNLLEIGINTVTKTAVGVETARPKRLEIEAFAMSKASEHGLDVPKVIQYGINEDGKEFLIMEKIDGVNVACAEIPVPLEKVYQNLGGRFSSITPDSNTFGWIIPGSHNGTHQSWNTFLVEHVEKYANGLCKRGTIDAPTTNQIISTIDKQTPNIPQASLIHRDLKPLNIMVDNTGQKVTVLDWECAMLGDPLFDAGVLHSRLHDDERLHKGFTRGILGGIPNNDQSRVVSVYSLVNLVDTLFAYRDKATKAMFTNLDKTIKNLNSRTPNFFAFQSKQILIPKPLPSYLND